MLSFLLQFVKKSLLVGGFISILSYPAMATPSTQIWIPSTDIQAFHTLHLGIDNYIRTVNDKDTRGAGITDIGLTHGISPFKAVQAEIGIDYLYMGDYVYDNDPIYLNFKIGTPEDEIFTGSPAIAAGGYNIGLKGNLTNYNIVYGMIAKTIPILGRVSAGYYKGNDRLLLDETGKLSNSGLLLSLDRAMPEISDKLWLAIDYQGGKNYLGSLNFGFSWAFSANCSVIFGYDIYNNTKTLYNSKDANVNTFTVQLDINI